MKRERFQIPIILFFTEKQPNTFEAVRGITELVITDQALVQQLQMHPAHANTQRTIVAQGIVEIQFAIALNQFELVDIGNRCFVLTVITARVFKLDRKAKRIENVVNTDIGPRSQ